MKREEREVGILVSCSGGGRGEVRFKGVLDYGYKCMCWGLSSKNICRHRSKKGFK